jgi:hypothetical protein
VEYVAEEATVTSRQRHSRNMKIFKNKLKRSKEGSRTTRSKSVKE